MSVQDMFNANATSTWCGIVEARHTIAATLCKVAANQVGHVVGENNAIVRYNDHPLTTHADILKVWTDAGKLLTENSIIK